MNKGFSPPDITEADIAAVAEALRSGWITTGPKTKEFERCLARHSGLGTVEQGQTPPVACMSSCTAALESALNLLQIGPGDEVITTAYTYSASCSVICHVGATPILVDTQENSYEMDYHRLALAVTSRTKAVIPVDVAGVLCDYNSLYAALDSAEAPYLPAPGSLQEAFSRPVVITDAAHSFGAQSDNCFSGSWADFTAFSFHAVKNLTTAEGGALAWRPGNFCSEALYQRLMLFSLHGQSKDALAKESLGGWEYDILAPLYKRNMTDVQAALGLSQLQRYDALLDRRHEIVQLYNRLLADLPLEILEHSGPDFRSSAHLFMLRLSDKDVFFRNALIVGLAHQGITCNVHYKPLPLFTAYQKLGFKIADFPQALACYQNEITLPLHTLLSDEDVEQIAAAFIATYRDLEAQYGY